MCTRQNSSVASLLAMACGRVAASHAEQYNPARSGMIVENVVCRHGRRKLSRVGWRRTLSLTGIVGVA